MNFFGKGKKGGGKRRGSRQPPPQEPFVDFSSPDAFSEENMAKMSGVDTIAFDENDPALMAELAELGWGEDESRSGGGARGARGGGGIATARPPGGHRPRPDMAEGRGASGGLQRQSSGNDLLRSLGLSLNSLAEPELTEQDLEDPDLLDELGEVSGGLDFGEDAATRGKVEDDGVGAGSYGDDDDDSDAVEPDRESEEEVDVDEEEMLASDDSPEEEQARPARPALPPRNPVPIPAPSSSRSDGGSGTAAAGEVARLEREVDALRHRAVELKKAGDRAGALEAMRAARSADHELAVLRTLETTRKVATVRTEYETPHADEEDQDEEEEEEEGDDEAPTPSPAGAGAGGGGGRPVSAELVMKQVKVLYQRAIELKKEGRTAEAMACLKRAKSLEADLVRDAQGKGLVAEDDEGGRRPSLLRQGSVNRRSSAGPVGDPTPAAARSESRSGSRAGLPANVKASIKPKVFPAQRDLFSDLEDALAAAVQLHVGRAKSLVKKDRAAAAKEVKRYKELQGKLDLTREMRVVPGARPPPWQWKITKTSRVRVLEQVAMDQVELEIYRVHGLTDKTDNRGSVWIKFDLGYSKDDKIGKGMTQSYRSDRDSVDMDFKTTSYVKRARSTQMAFQNRRAGLEIFHKKNIVSGAKLIGKCLVPLQPLLTTCELTVSTPILTEARREAGGSVEMSLRLRKPISSDEVVVTEEKELEVGEWPEVAPSPVVHAPAPAPAVAPAAAAAAAAAPPPAVPPAATTGGGGAGGAAGEAAAAAAAGVAAARVQAAARFENVVLTDTEKNDPFGVENLDSNNVLEAEIEAIAPKAATGDLAAVMRKGALETKLLMLVSAVQSGELDLETYCDILRERVIRDKVLAIYLKKEKRTKEAVAVMKRFKAMEEELAGVPQEEEGDEGGDA